MANFSARPVKARAATTALPGNGGLYIAPPKVDIAIGAANVLEGDPVPLGLSLSHASDARLFVALRYSGTAIDGVNFTGITSTEIAPGTTAVEIPLTTANDGINNADKTLVVTIAAITGADTVITTASATVGLTNNANLLTLTRDQTSVTEGNAAGFTVTGSVPAAADLSLFFSYTGTAIDGVNFTGIASATLVTGATQTSVSIDTLNDGLYRGAVSLVMHLDSVTGSLNAMIGTNVDTVTIEEVQPAPVFSLAADGASVIEGAAAAFTVTSTTPAGDAVVINLQYSGTASAGVNFTGVANMVMPSGATSVALVLATIDDGIFAGDHTLTATMASVTGADATINTATDTVSLLDNQSAPVISIAADIDNVTEGQAATFLISASNGADVPITVNFAYSGTATDGVDFTGLANTTLPAGDTDVGLSITTVDDGIFAGANTLTVTLDSVSGASATINTATDTVTLLDNQSAPVISIAADTDNVTEGQAATFLISASNGADVPITINFAYSGTATDGVDFTGIASTTLPAGDTDVGLSIATVDDTLFAGAKTLTVTLDSVSGASATISTATDTVTLLDKQSAPVISIAANSASVTEGQAATFLISASNGADVPITFNFAYSGTATDGVDFTGIASTTLPAGDTDVGLSITTVDDGIFAGANTLTVTLDSVSGASATISTATDTVTLLDNQSAPVVSIAADIGSVIEGQAAAFTISTSVATDVPVVVNFAYTGTAIDGVDFTGVASKTLPALSTATALSITTADLGLYHTGKTLTVTMISVSGASATINTAADTVTLTTGAPVPEVVSVSNATVTVGDDLVFAVALNNGANSVINFPYGVTLVEAVPGDIGAPLFSDGVTLNGASVDIPAGVADFSVTIPTTA